MRNVEVRNQVNVRYPTRRNWYNSAFWKYKGVSAQMLVFDDASVCGIRAYARQSSAHSTAMGCPPYLMLDGRLAQKQKPCGNTSAGLLREEDETYL